MKFPSGCFINCFQKWSDLHFYYTNFTHKKNLLQGPSLDGWNMKRQINLKKLFFRAFSANARTNLKPFKEFKLFHPNYNMTWYSTEKMNIMISFQKDLTNWSRWKNICNGNKIFLILTVWKVSKYVVFSGPYFPHFSRSAS